MQVVVLAGEQMKQELLAQGQSSSLEVIWVKEAGQFTFYREANAYFDLQFKDEEKRMDLYRSLPLIPIFINSVYATPETMPRNIIRINAWPTLLERKLAEAYCPDKDLQPVSETIFAALNKKIEWLDNKPGFISARVIAMIINEAYFTLGEKVSTKEDIDVAMKLGTNYPYGPFEWAGRIGLRNIEGLLNAMSSENSCYQPAPLLVKEANQ